MFMFCVFAVTDLVIIGIFYAVYGTKRKYSEGMLLGVHLPQSAADSAEVKAFMARYGRNTKIFYVANTLISIAVCGFCFWYFSVFIIAWSVWLLEFCIGALVLLYGTHRKLYDMKVEKGWVGSSGSRIMAVDTKAAAHLVVVSGLDANGEIGAGMLVVYCIMETIPGFFMIGGFFYMRSRKEKLLRKNDRPMYIDDDVYWKNGWYSNPNDKRLMVQDWACTWNYTTNMARPAGKIFMFLALLFVAACLVWGCVLIWKIDFVPIGLNISGTQVVITSGYSDYGIACDDITGVELLDSLPDDDYRKINGGEDQHKMMGRFKGENTGKCRMYLYTGYTPVLEIMTGDGPVYVNSKDPQETEEWMREISVNIAESS